MAKGGGGKGGWARMSRAQRSAAAKKGWATRRAGGGNTKSGVRVRPKTGRIGAAMQKIARGAARAKNKTATTSFEKQAAVVNARNKTGKGTPKLWRLAGRRRR